MRSELLDIRAGRGSPDDIPEHLRRNPVAQIRPESFIARVGTGTAHVSAFSDEIRNGPVLLAQLEQLEPEGSPGEGRIRSNYVGF